jgi:hypothetical protein
MRRTAFVLASLLIAMEGLAACQAGKLSTASSCADWNNADINAQGTYIQERIRAGVPRLNRWTGFASGEVSRYCSYDPGANLGTITVKVSNES